MGFFTGKKVVITGGSSGIGKASAMLFAKDGADVCIVARNTEKLVDATKELASCAQSPHQKALYFELDISDRAKVFSAGKIIVEKLGGIDILVNCAGITWPGYLHTIPDKVWDDIMNIDYMGTVNMVRAFIPFFMEQKHGHIANVSSVCGYMGVFGYGAYCPPKFAVTGFSECLRQDLLKYNISVSVIFPPDTNTPQLLEENKIKPMETKVLAGNVKILSPEKVARAFLDGIEKRKFIIVPGLMNKITYFLSKHFPSIIWMIVSGDLRKFWKKQNA